MRLLIAAILIAVSTFLLSGFGPWWLGAVLALVFVGLLRLKPAAGYLAGFIGVFVAWAVCAGWIDLQNHSMLSTRIGALLGSMSSVTLIVVSALLGGFVGGLSGLTAGLIVQWVSRQRNAVKNEGHPAVHP